MTITVVEVTSRTFGSLIALFERVVGLYASLIGINAYHQPGVEAGKKAAGAVIAIQKKVLEFLKGGKSGTAEEIAAGIGEAAEVETVYLTLRHLAANPEHQVMGKPGEHPTMGVYQVRG
jgi:glucose-6-phosphate isomerase